MVALSRTSQPIGMQDFIITHFQLAELKTEKQNRVSANEKAQKNASEVEQQNELYRDKILELEDEKYKLQEQVEGIKNAIHFQASDLEKVKSEGIQYIKGSFKL